jgi:hypothetical protein
MTCSLNTSSLNHPDISVKTRQSDCNYIPRITDSNPVRGTVYVAPFPFFLLSWVVTGLVMECPVPSPNQEAPQNVLFHNSES